MCTANKIKKDINNKTNKIFYGMASNCFKHMYLLFRVFMDKVIDFVFSWIWDTRKAIPDLEPKHKILAESATSLAKKIRNKELKAEELMKCVIERIKAVNSIINAVTDERFEDALKEAKEIDRKIAEGLPDEYFDKRPFLGVPFTAKESHAMLGLRHTLGLTARRETRAGGDARCVSELRAAGAVPVAVTNVPEINKWQETRNHVFGQTCNPYHLGRTPGGSSGGEAALAAALATPISLCSDIGGSTRMPAFYCGLFGHNPTAGTTSLQGSTLRSGKDDTMASIGFVSRRCADLAPLTRVVAAEKGALLALGREVHVKDIKFYYTETATDLRVSPICGDLRKAMNKVVSRLSTDSSKPTPYTHPGFSHMFALWKYHMSKESECFPRMLTNNRGYAVGLAELVKKCLGLSQYTLAAVLKLLDEQVLPQPPAEWAESLTRDMRRDLTELLGTDGVLLFPSAPHPAPYHYSAFLRPFNFAYWGLFNVLRFPATQVPLGLNSQGLPLGIQVVAAPHQDALCLAVAQHLEDLFGGYVPPCKV
ncbi:fatty-acid amide hydrolase 2 isoform X2 [Plutella xylostella]|uniref:fatty-acid amide hydrolase 2 isoform X1 n=2 Tax=Plutella xylostella TaxID=51655 RepID=UPI0020329645|nr:fatty-acid amide hydrolase 2 isoform X1 [Plutella xylostella]XP_048478569.1 fatty-acid amide hydrolase 2 isoform X2 [Plutella xylostella]